MGFPPWFRQVIQGRLDEVSARIEHHPELHHVRAEEGKAFRALFAGMNVGRMPEFGDWEDKHNLKHAIMNEWLYLQGMMDGIELAVTLLNQSAELEDDAPVEADCSKPRT